MLKQVILGFTVLVLLVAGTALLLVGYPQEDEDIHGGLEIAGPYGVQKVPEITSAIAFPRYSGQAMVYRTIDTTVSKDDALKMAEKFGMTGSLEEDTLSYYIKGNPYTFDIEREGGYMTYTWDDRHSGVDPRDRPENLPTDEECRKIAESFLTSHGLVPEGAVFSSVSHGEGFFLNSTDDTSVQTYKDTRVLFTGTLSGYPVTGSGIYVTVGGGGMSLRSANVGAMPNPTRNSRSSLPKKRLRNSNRPGSSPR